MLIPFQTVLNTHHLHPKGILHIGAHHAEELGDYLAEGIQDIVFIEAIPEKCDYMRSRHEIQQLPRIKVINACVSDVTGAEVEFNVTNNGQSSSMLKLALHKEMHPEVVVTSTFKTKTIRVDELLRQHGLDIANYDFVNLDIQGAELLALKGMRSLLKHVNCIYTEVNSRHLYENCALIWEIDDYLRPLGFVRLDTKMTACHWGDSAFLRL